MAAEVAGSKRLGPWFVGVGLVCVIVLGAGTVAWIWLPRWAPEWVLKNSPWTSPALRAATYVRAQVAAQNRLVYREDEREWQVAEIPFLVRALEDENVRVSAVVALGQIEGPLIIPHLVMAMADNPDPEVRMYAVRGLGKRDVPTARAAVMDGLKDRNSEVRSEVLGVLWKVHLPDNIPGLVEFMVDCSLGERVEAIQVLRNTKDPRVRDLLIAQSQDGAVRELLIARLSDPDESMRLDAIAVLSDLPGPGVVAALGSHLDDPPSADREVLLKALAKIDEPDSSRLLARFLLQSSEESVASMARYHVAEALAQRRDQAATEAMFAVLTDPEVHWAAGKALAGRPELYDLDRLRPALTHANPHVRSTALGLCIACGGRPLVLQAFINDPDQKVRNYAAGLLSQSRDDAEVPKYQKPDVDR